MTGWVTKKEKPKDWSPKKEKPKDWITRKAKKPKDWITRKKKPKSEPTAPLTQQITQEKPKDWITKKKPKKRQYKGISEKSGHTHVPKKYPEDKHGRFKGKVFDASPKILSKAGMTESKRYGTPIYSKTFENGKLTKVGERSGHRYENLNPYAADILEDFPSMYN